MSLLLLCSFSLSQISILISDVADVQRIKALFLLQTASSSSALFLIIKQPGLSLSSIFPFDSSGAPPVCRCLIKLESQGNER